MAPEKGEGVMNSKRIKRKPKKSKPVVGEVQHTNHVEGLRWAEVFRGPHHE